MAGSILGNRVLRKEDPKFLTSGGKYVDDLLDEPLLEGAAHVTYVRSSVAHGRILSIDTSAASKLPGVIGVFTAADLGLEVEPSAFNPAATRGKLAIDKVRFVGEPVAVIITETRDQGEDAIEQVVVEYDVLEALVDPEAAMTSSTLIYEGVGSNVVFDTTALGMPDNTGDEYFADCEVVVTGRFVNQRVAPCPLEVRGSAVAWVRDGSTRLYQWLSTQGAQGARDSIMAGNGLTAEQLRVITPDVGGGFGAKITCYPEEILLGQLSKRVGRPLRWRENRTESMMVLGHGRAQIQYVTMGGNRDGKVTHYRLHAIQDCGGFVEIGTILAPFMTRPMSSAVYDIPNIECRTTSVVTNTTPVTAYRGAGRPEATAAAERAMDMFAAEIGMDPVEVRRRNLIPKFGEPHTTAIGQTYDVGDFEGALDKALEAADYTSLRAEQAARRESGSSKQLGIGVSVYVEITGGVAPFGEHAKIEVLDDGRAVVYTGTSPHGQGHITSWSMLAHEQTGIPMDKIELVWGDTDLVPTGIRHDGLAVAAAGRRGRVDRRRASSSTTPASSLPSCSRRTRPTSCSTRTAARSTSPAHRQSASRGPNCRSRQRRTATSRTGWRSPATSRLAARRSRSARTSRSSRSTPRPARSGTSATSRATTPARVLNPMLLEGQIHGGVAQGTAQALLEEVRYDSDGNPITSNLADYAFISAAELPSIEVVHMETPTFVNPLGAKGIGESGTIGSTPAVQSAVIDAVSHLGVRHIDMPCTAERVWNAIEAART